MIYIDSSPNSIAGSQEEVSPVLCPTEAFVNSPSFLSGHLVCGPRPPGQPKPQRMTPRVHQCEQEYWQTEATLLLGKGDIC
jgi:hypothetical protein